ncbi:response regulator transcription factor [Bradyrhizobium jicamae]|uniref:Response regulator transcription factor n=1 Tax=Bradyrhizobium jicamae TaxID=280332 RepID=A0ABS5FB46_9BRAD|nr:response regulator transcription factor [Bradyrhizobium jicamae]MBR0794014.1 response regulator transcription factor [Bradyrhizobium jicamae]MBR0932156.1 response regulator transcription factor [Bradyrhizobium jicamae]
MRSVSVVIADRHPVVLQGLSNVIGAQRDFKVVARCGDGASCVEAIRHFVPDIAVLDITMPDMSGADILAVARSEKIPTRPVFFAASIEDRELSILAAAGAYGVVLRDQEPEILVQTLREVAAGERLLPLPSSEEAISCAREMMTGKSLVVLTERERQIVHLVSEGLSNKEIGRLLSVTDGTIKVHLHHIFQKLDISNRTSLAALAISQHDFTASAAERPDQRELRTFATTSPGRRRPNR